MAHHGEEWHLKQRIKKHLATLHRAGGAMEPTPPYVVMPVTGGYGANTLDFLCCINGKFVAIETKAFGKQPTAMQILIMEAVRGAGGIAFWCDSFNSYWLNMFAHGFVGHPDMPESMREKPKKKGRTLMELDDG